MRTSYTGINRRFADCAQSMALVGLFLGSPAVEDIYPIKGVWVAQIPISLSDQMKLASL